MSKDLINAITVSNILKVTEIVQSKPGWLLNPGANNASRELPLHVAASIGDLEIIKVLLQYAPGLPKILDNAGCSAFFHTKSERVAALLLQNMDKETICKLGPGGRSTLFIAVSHDWETVVQKILAQSPQLAKEKYSGYAIFHFCGNSNITDMLAAVAPELLNDMSPKGDSPSKTAQNRGDHHLAVYLEKTHQTHQAQKRYRESMAEEEQKCYRNDKVIQEDDYGRHREKQHKDPWQQEEQQRPEPNFLGLDIVQVREPRGQDEGLPYKQQSLPEKANPLQQHEEEAVGVEHPIEQPEYLPREELELRGQELLKPNKEPGQGNHLKHANLQQEQELEPREPNQLGLDEEPVRNNHLEPEELHHKQELQEHNPLKDDGELAQGKHPKREDLQPKLHGPNLPKQDGAVVHDNHLEPQKLLHGQEPELHAPNLPKQDGVVVHGNHPEPQKLLHGQEPKLHAPNLPKQDGAVVHGNYLEPEELPLKHGPHEQNLLRPDKEQVRDNHLKLNDPQHEQEPEPHEQDLLRTDKELVQNNHPEHGILPQGQKPHKPDLLKYDEGQTQGNDFQPNSLQQETETRLHEQNLLRLDEEPPQDKYLKPGGLQQEQEPELPLPNQTNKEAADKGRTLEQANNLQHRNGQERQKLTPQKQGETTTNHKPTEGITLIQPKDLPHAAEVQPPLPHLVNEKDVVQIIAPMQQTTNLLPRAKPELQPEVLNTLKMDEEALKHKSGSLPPEQLQKDQKQLGGTHAGKHIHLEYTSQKEKLPPYQQTSYTEQQTQELEEKEPSQPRKTIEAFIPSYNSQGHLHHNPGTWDWQHHYYQQQNEAFTAPFHCYPYPPFNPHQVSHPQQWNEKDIGQFPASIGQGEQNELLQAARWLSSYRPYNPYPQQLENTEPVLSDSWLVLEKEDRYHDPMLGSFVLTSDWNKPLNSYSNQHPPVPLESEVKYNNHLPSNCFIPTINTYPPLSPPLGYFPLEQQEEFGPIPEARVKDNNNSPGNYLFPPMDTYSPLNPLGYLPLEPTDEFKPISSYSAREIGQLIALQLPKGIAFQIIDQSTLIEDKAITHLIESAIKTGIAVLPLQDEEGLVLKSMGEEILRLIHLRPDKTTNDASWDLIHRICSLSPWEVSFTWLQYEKPYYCEKEHTFAIENLVKIAKCQDKKKAELCKQLVDPVSYPILIEKHQLILEDQAWYSHLKFSKLLKSALADTKTYTTTLTILNKGGNSIDKYQYREKIEENLRNAVEKIGGGQLGYTSALVPLQLHEHDYAGIFLTSESSNLYVAFIHPRKEPLEQEKNFCFLSTTLYTLSRDYSIYKFLPLCTFGKFHNNDDSGPLVIGCTKFLSTFSNFKDNFSKVPGLVSQIDVDNVRSAHVKVLHEQDIPVREWVSTPLIETDSIGLSGQNNLHSELELS